MQCNVKYNSQSINQSISQSGLGPRIQCNAMIWYAFQWCVNANECNATCDAMQLLRIVSHFISSDCSRSRSRCCSLFYPILFSSVACVHVCTHTYIRLSFLLSLFHSFSFPWYGMKWKHTVELPHMISHHITSVFLCIFHYHWIESWIPLTLHCIVALHSLKILCLSFDLFLVYNCISLEMKWRQAILKGVQCTCNGNVIVIVIQCHCLLHSIALFHSIG